MDTMNLLRTHYTPSQRAMFSARLATLRRGQIGGGRTRSPNLEITIAEAGRRFGVSPSMVFEAKALCRDAAPDLAEAVRETILTFMVSPAHGLPG